MTTKYIFKGQRLILWDVIHYKHMSSSSWPFIASKKWHWCTTGINNSYFASKKINNIDIKLMPKAIYESH